MTTIAIICSAEVHQDDHYELFLFSRKVYGERTAWVAGSNTLGNPGVTSKSAPKVRRWGATQGRLLGDRYLTDGEADDPMTLMHPDFRIRYEFKCDCGDKVEARYDRLAPILDVLASAGINTISLRALAARLEASTR